MDLENHYTHYTPTCLTWGFFFGYFASSCYFNITYANNSSHTDTLWQTFMNKLHSNVTGVQTHHTSCEQNLTTTDVTKYFIPSEHVKQERHWWLLSEKNFFLHLSFSAFEGGNCDICHEMKSVELPDFTNFPHKGKNRNWHIRLFSGLEWSTRRVDVCGWICV